MTDNQRQDRQESCKSYLEQTKLLVTLSSAFLLPPAFIYTVLQVSTLKLLFLAEACFACSVFFGYIVFGSIAGTQRSGEYDVYRPATRLFSLLQIAAYIIGLTFFVLMCVRLDDDENRLPKLKDSTPTHEAPSKAFNPTGNKPAN